VVEGGIWIGGAEALLDGLIERIDQERNAAETGNQGQARTDAAACPEELGARRVERQQARALRPDVVLMDIRMPHLDGIQATRRLMQTEAPPRVLMLTTYDLDEYLYEAMKAGASGFLLKDTRPEQLPDAVRTVARGEALLGATPTRRLIEAFVRRPPPGSQRPQQLQQLSDRELEVLRLIAHGHSNKEIAQTLFLSEATEKTHLTRVFTKLGLRDRVQAVVLAYETGLVEPGHQTSG
jgi:DNA-binding NarL/FixJ family response regulator